MSKHSLALFNGFCDEKGLVYDKMELWGKEIEGP